MAQAEELLKTPDVARQLGVNVETVRLWVKRNQIPHVLLPSGRPRFYQADIDAILATKPVAEREVTA